MEDESRWYRLKKNLQTVLCGLQFKGTALLILFAFALALVGEALIRKSTAKLVIAQQIESAVAQCSYVSSGVARDLHQRDISQLQRKARQWGSNRAILYVEYYDDKGQWLTALNRGQVRAAAIGGDALLDLKRLEQQPMVQALVQDQPPYLDVASSAMIGTSSTSDDPGTLAGYVRMGFDLSGVQSRLAGFLQNVRLVGLGVLLTMVPLAFMVVRTITSPINALSEAVTQLARGDFRVRANILRRDEIGKLAINFNTMADELATSNDRLVKLNAELEDRVLQRTRQLKDLAARDPLTSLYNRRHLNEVLTRRFSESERYDNDLSCMMIDLDHFKAVNDQYGHKMGDNLLILTAKVIMSELRGADVAARFGGDEFCVLLPQTSAEQAHQVGLRIVERFQVEVKSELPAKDSPFGISVGVAGLRELHLVSPDELVKAADQALYHAKESGKNRIHCAAALA